MLKTINPDGSLKISLISGAVPSGAFYNGGLAYAADGSLYVKLTQGALSGQTYNGGFACTPDGALYVTDNATSSSSVINGGVLCRADGAVHVSGVGGFFTAGMPVSATGVVFVDLFDIATWYSSLTHSLIPERGTATLSFVRATTATGQNNDGYQFTALAGEAVFDGASRIDNLVRLGAAQSSTLAAAAAITMTLPAGAYQFSMGAGTGTATFSGTGGATGTLDATVAGRVHVAKTITDGTLVVTASVATLTDLQVVSMVDTTDQTTIREYVSVGVESAPAYHGPGVDGVLYSDRDINGNPITGTFGYRSEAAATNVLFKSNTLNDAAWVAAGTPTVTQNAFGAGGALSAWTITDDSAVVVEGLSQTKTLTAAAWVISCKVAKTSGATTFPCLFANVFPSLAAVCTVDTNNGVATTWPAVNLHAGVPSNLTARCTSYSDDLWLVELTFTASAALWGVSLFPAVTTNATFSGPTADVAVTGSAVFTEIQWELGTKATSYIDNTSAVASATRNADVLSYTTSGLVVAAAGTLALTFTPDHTASGTIALWGTYVDADNYTAILHDATNLIFRKRIAATNYDATIALAFVAGTSYSIAASWGAGGTTITLDGVEGTPHANTTAAQIGSTMQYGALNSVSQPGAILTDAYAWLRQLSGSERAAVTA